LAHAKDGGDDLGSELIWIVLIAASGIWAFLFTAK
jgi:hypothetical protein